MEEWRRTGLSASEFCREHQVGPQRLRYWAERFNAKEAATSTPEFHVFPLPFAAPETTPVATPGRRTDGSAIEIRIDDRIALRLPDGAEFDMVSRALRAALDVVGS